MKLSLILSLLMAVGLSIVISRIIYFGFTPNYAADVFSKQTFNFRFDRDVYKYRILSKYLLFTIDDMLAKNMPENGADPRLKVYTPDASERFYLAFYYLNTIFLCLTSVVAVALVNLNKHFDFSKAEKQLVVLLLPLVIGISQFTVCCYDVSSYFFQLLTLLLFLLFIEEEFWFTTMSLAALTFVSTLNRESSALSVALMILLYLVRFGLKRRVVIGLGLIILAFMLTYYSLRVFIQDPPDHYKIINFDAGKIWRTNNVYGLAFWAILLYFSFATSSLAQNKSLISLFIILCIPYIYTCLKDGVLWEIRLFIPIWLGSLFLSRMKASTYPELLKIKTRILR